MLFAAIISSMKNVQIIILPRQTTEAIPIMLG